MLRSRAAGDEDLSFIIAPSRSLRPKCASELRFPICRRRRTETFFSAMRLRILVNLFILSYVSLIDTERV